METKTAVEICPTTTQAHVKAGALLVDVRERDEVAQIQKMRVDVAALHPQQLLKPVLVVMHRIVMAVRVVNF